MNDVNENETILELYSKIEEEDYINGLYDESIFNIFNIIGMINAINIYNENFKKKGNQSMAQFQRDLLQCGLILVDINLNRDSKELSRSFDLCQELQNINDDPTLHLSDLRDLYFHQDFKIVLISNRKETINLIDGEETNVYFICKLQSTFSEKVIS